jgi:hypothetical protein
VTPDEIDKAVAAHRVEISRLLNLKERRAGLWQQVMDDKENAILDSKTKVIVAMQLALDDNLDDCPTYLPDLRDRLLSKISELRVKAGLGGLP